jgi:hypothetical protein
MHAGAPTQYSGYATCADALADIPGYSYVVQMLKHCPDLDAMHSDPTQQKTFFVPSNSVSGIAMHPLHAPARWLLFSALHHTAADCIGC